MSKKLIRCAIYTRKSSEEGLEQSFNSLDAQRDACESYIKSQKHEGWIVLKNEYDDGGFSGGSMDRPALQRLLADIGEGKIDTVVVYKIDRLTRSLLDFSKIVEAFDSKEVSFVSVTQQFNTTTSMGRLTLNILLSFAQFEREVTGERIRDKIAASKRKGIWMGGNVPLGYKVKDRLLLIDPVAAKTVRHIFEQYLEFGCVPKLNTYLEKNHIFGKQQKPFSRGALYHILTSRIYLGEIVHRKQTFPGQHQGIIDRDLWEKVAAKLKDNDPVANKQPRATESSLLAGLLFDAAGVRYTPTHAVKKGKRYRYYTSQSVIQHKEPSGIARIPARELERIVEARIQRLLSSPVELIKALGVENSARLSTLAARRSEQWAKLDSNEITKFVKPILKRVVMLPDSVELELSCNQLKAHAFGEKPPSDSEPGDQQIRLVANIGVRAHRGETRIISDFSEPDDDRQSLSLMKAICRAREWYERIVRGEFNSFEALATQNRVSTSYVRRIFRCASLAPEIVESLASNRPTLITLETFRRQPPLDWTEQRRTL
jgi:DNA invertase Pin-like site-specific DNA recombinase